MIIKEHLKNTLQLWKSSFDELLELQTFLSEEKINNQFYRRLFIISIFSIIETYIYVIKEIIKIKLVTDGNANNQIDWPELAILNEKKILLDDRGKVKVKEEFQRFEPSLRFTVNTFEKVFHSKLLDYSDPNFERLIGLVKRRNEITHPKSLNELFITNQEIKDSVSMIAWFLKLHGTISNNKDYMDWLVKMGKL